MIHKYGERAKERTNSTNSVSPSRYLQRCTSRFWSCATTAHSSLSSNHANRIPTSKAQTWGKLSVGTVTSPAPVDDGHNDACEMFLVTFDYEYAALLRHWHSDKEPYDD
eukprot:GHVT01025959.1.p2 GENE.GHVT01025959.1~~GHVT01025959.1.p2  ORF type:complete len:109 (-),score=2.94 GHVT01025959.1:1558-1884(-)